MDRSNKYIEQFLRLRNILEKKEKNKRNRIVIMRLSEEDYERLKYVEARPGTSRYDVISTDIEMLYNIIKTQEINGHKNSKM